MSAASAIARKFLRAQWSRRWLVSTALVLVLAVPSFAVLGGSDASVQSDQIVFQASLQARNAGVYTVHELKTPSGIWIREYAAGGTIFAVAWQGPWRPDMRQLLGSYFDEYAKALQTQGRRPGRKPVRIELPDLVVTMGGHLRGFTGHAYVPGMLPQGVREEELR